MKKLKVNDKVVFQWLGGEYIGKIIEITKEGKEEKFLVLSEGTRYRCYDSSKFGLILWDQTENLCKGEYVKKVKTNADVMIEEMDEMLQQIKELNELGYPKRRIKEFKNLVVDFRKKLSELHKEVINKK